MLNGENTSKLHTIVSKNGTLTAQIRAVKALTAQKSAYLSREAESKALKDDIMHALNQGASNVLPKIEQQKEITSQLRDMEANMCLLLQEADLFTVMKEFSPETRDIELERLHSLPATTAPSILGGAENNNHRNSPVASNSAFKPDYDARESRLVTSKYRTSSFTGSLGIPEANRTKYHEVMSDDETTFTGNMGSTLPPVEDFDDFDMDVLDEDILEAADNCQDEQPFTKDSHEPHSRPVFAETSGNVRRLPATQKSQTHGTLWGQHPWTKDVKIALKERFHLRGFRPNQLEAIDSTLSGKDTFVLMPTGGGKSLCYQLPSVISSGSTRGVTLVISPLLSLMQDQVSHLRQNKIKAYLINGDTPSEERQWIMSTLSSHNPETHIELLYITPEMVSKSHALTDRIEKLCSIQKLARVVIDEAHCVSQWGHDFRPDYKQIGAFRARIPGVPLMALTATATENVKVDVIHNLRMQGCEVFTQSFNRPNLTYEVRRKGKHAELLDSIADTIKSTYRNKCGIVYCLSRNTCEKVAEALRTNYRIKAEHYHAGLDAETRAQTQQRWQAGDVHVIVATIAFGMGIDKPDVRFVIHHSIPKSLEGYYQETGRAGRDGRRSGCYLYFSHRDVSTMQNMIEKNEDSDGVQKSRQTRMLNDVVKYCENANDCRRVQILAYFSESFKRQDCNASCDNCKSGDTFEVQDFSEHASAAIKIVRYFQERNERATLSYCVNIFRGTTKSFRSPEHREAPSFGDGSSIAVGDAERLFRKLQSERALIEENIVNRGNFPIQYVKLGPRASDFESGRRRLRLDVRVSLDGSSRPRGDVGRNYLPQSTNVSSPVRSANRLRLERYRHVDSAANESDTDVDSDGFEKVRIAGREERKKKIIPGPPITQGDRFDQLDHLHRAVAEDFMVYAKNYCQEVVMDKGLRNQPFSDTILREMVMVFPKDKGEMLQIPNIDPDKVHRYGDKILKLLRDTKQRLFELKQAGDDVDGVVPDPNHHNVVNISDDEFSDADDVFMYEDDILHPDDTIVTSEYFSRSQQPFEDDSNDEYHPSPKASISKSQKQKNTGKRPRRKSGGAKQRAKGTRKPKTSSRSQGRSSSRKETKGRQKQPTGQIAMMPI
jgi:bloom syndrome protein